LALRVRDDDYPYPGGGGGEIGEGIDTVQVTVNNVPPAQVDAGGPYYGHQGQSIRLSGSATDVPADPLGDGNYTWDLDNNGTFETTGQIVNHTWAVTGTYTVVLRVDDFDGAVRRIRLESPSPIGLHPLRQVGLTLEVRVFPSC